ncbi:MAG: UDP-N-acetylmuramate dehydrogenase [Clostridia bacterium]|nr:UDP-N-acetylmuramate dehydrogenase [Clostridia bacterium]
MKLDLFKKALDEKGIEYKTLEPMKNHTSFKIGGKADIFLKVKDISSLKYAIFSAKENDVPVFILGKGSNLLVSDEGIEGAVISLLGLDEISAENDRISCAAGVPLSSLCRFARDNSLAGLEFAYGIPGSVGGAVYMNAGAYGGEMADVLESVTCMDKDGNICEISAKDMELGYRNSVFMKNGMIVLSAKLKLKSGKQEDITAAMEDYMNRRLSKQPLEYPSAGSTFKRPEGYFAGALIEENGLKGMSVGGAMVSEKHAGFVINYKNASCKDVKELINRISECVFENNGVKLQTEVIFVGR